MLYKSFLKTAVLENYFLESFFFLLLKDRGFFFFLRKFFGIFSRFDSLRSLAGEFFVLISFLFREKDVEGVKFAVEDRKTFLDSLKSGRTLDNMPLEPLLRHFVGLIKGAGDCGVVVAAH